MSLGWALWLPVSFHLDRVRPSFLAIRVGPLWSLSNPPFFPPCIMKSLSSPSVASSGHWALHRREMSGNAC